MFVSTFFNFIYIFSQANCNSNYHLAYTLPIVASSLIFNVPRFFELRTEMKMSNFTYYNNSLENYTTEERMMPALLPTDIRKDPIYTRDYVLVTQFDTKITLVSYRF